MIELVGVAAIVAGLLVMGLGVAFSKGWIGLTPERIKALHDKGDQLQAKLEAKMAKKSMPGDAVTRLAAKKALLDAKLITQEEFDAAKAKILAE